MLINFGFIKDFKNTEKWTVLKSSISNHEVSFSEIRKLKSYNLYTNDLSIRTGKKMKAVWTKCYADGEDILVLIDVVKGKYERSKYFKQNNILEQFFQGGDSVNRNITSEFFEESFYEIGSEVDRPFYFFQRKVIRLSSRQEEILQKYFFPGFYILNGMAGSGKTSIAYLKLKALCKNEGNFLFTTGNRNLAEFLETMFMEEENDGKVVFLGYGDLIEYYFPSTRCLQKVDYSFFKSYSRRSSVKYSFSNKMLYSLMQYIATKSDLVPGKRDFFKEIKMEEFKYCCKFYYSYCSYLEKERKIDLSLFALTPESEKRFDYIIVDETQDLSPREIENISLLRKADEGVIIFNIDCNQHSHISLPVKYLKSHNCTKEVIDILDSSFRIPKNVLKYAQAIVEVRSFVLKGVPDKQTIREFKSSNPINGNIVHISIQEARNIVNNVNVAVLAFDNDEKVEVEQILSHITQIFTIDEIKGLEYESVVVFNPYERFSKTLMKHHEVVFDESEVKTALPRDINTVDHEVKIIFNLFFTAVTRTKNNLYILEKFRENSKKCYSLFKKYLTKDVLEGEIRRDVRSTQEEWIKQVYVLALNGNISQALKAYNRSNFCLKKFMGLYPHLLTYEICLVAVVSNIMDLLHVPERWRGYKLHRDILCHKIFKDIPESLKSEAFCRDAVNIDVENLLYVPLTYTSVYESVMKRYSYELSNTPEHLINLNMCSIALKMNFKVNFNYIPRRLEQEVYKAFLTELYNSSLENFPLEFWNDRLVMIALRLNIYNLKHLTEKQLTKNVHRFALEQYNDNLENFPKEIMTDKLAEVAVNLNAYNLLHLAETFRSDNVYRSALRGYENSIENFPRDLINRFNRLPVLAVESKPDNLRFHPFNNSLERFPYYLITQKVAEQAVQLSAHNLKQIRKVPKYAKLFNMDAIYKAALKSYKNSLLKFPKDLFFHDLFVSAVRLNAENLKLLKPKQKTKKVYMEVFETHNITIIEFFILFPEENINYCIAEAAVTINARNLNFIPIKFVTENLYRTMLKPYHYWLRSFPHDLLNQQIAEIAVKSNKMNMQQLHLFDVRIDRQAFCLAFVSKHKTLESVPEDLIDPELALLAAMLHAENFRFVPAWCINESFLLQTLAFHNNSLELFPKDAYGFQRIAEVAVQINIENLQYLSDEDEKWHYLSRELFPNFLSIL